MINRVEAAPIEYGKWNLAAAVPARQAENSQSGSRFEGKDSASAAGAGSISKGGAADQVTLSDAALKRAGLRTCNT
ncbi:MAG: hypothetical protein ACM3MK_12540 [Chitinophagales bacterium]